MDDADVVYQLRKFSSRIINDKPEIYWKDSSSKYIALEGDSKEVFHLIRLCTRRKIVEAYDLIVEVIDYISKIPDLDPENYWNLKTPIDDIAMYFAYVWCENKDSLDKERPEKIFLRLRDECNWRMRTVVFVLGTFRDGFIGYMDTAGGGIGDSKFSNW